MHILLLFKSKQINVGLRYCISFLIILLLLVGTCINSVAESRVEAIFTTTLPVSGWNLEGQPYRYIPQNLYKYINGGADFFIAYGFIELTGANYSPVSGERDFVTIDIYDLGNKLNAFGVFQSRRDSHVSSLNIGTASVASDGYIAFYKDRFYVEIQAYIISKKDKGVIKNMASSVAELLPGENSLPMELSYLPEKGRIAGSERYIRVGILGHAFLDRGIMCDYQNEGEKVSAFVAILPSYQDAVKAVEQHRSFLKKSKKKCLPLDKFGEHSFVSKEPYHNKIIETQRGKFVVGVYDLSTIETGKTLLADILKNIKQTSGKSIPQ